MNLKITCIKNGADALSFYAKLESGQDENRAAEEFTDTLRKQGGCLLISGEDAVTGDWLFVDLSKFDAVKARVVEFT